MTNDRVRNIVGSRTALPVMSILLELASKPDGRTLTQLAGSLALPKTSAFNLLKVLLTEGYVRRIDGRYFLGDEALKLGAKISQSRSFPQCAKPVMQKLAEETGETIMLGVLSPEGREVIYLEVIESDAPLRFTVRSGNRRPLYATASGKAILAFLTIAQQEAYLTSEVFSQFTSDTSNRKDLEKVLPAARERAVIADIGGFIEGTTGVASPCFNDSGTVACSLSIAGPTQRLTVRQDRIAALTLSGAEEISRILGFQGNYPARPL